MQRVDTLLVTVDLAQMVLCVGGVPDMNQRSGEPGSVRTGKEVAAEDKQTVVSAGHQKFIVGQNCRHEVVVASTGEVDRIENGQRIVAPDELWAVVTNPDRIRRQRDKE